MRRTFSALTLVALLAGCDLAPHYARPASAAPTQWPTGAAYAPSTPQAAEQPGGLPWRTMISDAKLVRLIEQALANNRDLRIAAANVQQARAQFRIQRADRLPTVGLTGAATYTNSLAGAAGAAAGGVGGGTGAPGGTGVANDWTAIRRFQSEGAFAGLPPVIAAGGLTPENVGPAIEAVEPRGVDVSGGVEIDGEKSAERIFEFVRAAKKSNLEE